MNLHLNDRSNNVRGAQSSASEQLRRTGIWPEVVLFATDGFGNADNLDPAAEKAVSIARETGAELHVVHVWHNIPTAHFRGLVRAELKRRGREELDQQVERIEETGVQVSGAYLRTGHVADEIVELGEEIEAGLIVVGSRDLGHMGRAVLGSVSAEIIRHASCPVLVVGKKGRRQTPVQKPTAMERSA